MTQRNPTRLLISAGATKEAIDSVRYIGNKSSGQLGVLLGLAGAVHSYDVTLLLGTNSTTPPSHPRLKTIWFSSARDLDAKLKELWPSHNILIMAAAVADFTPRGGQSKSKIRRGSTDTIELSPTDDIVANLAKNAREDQRVICFALEEPSKLEVIALEKMKRKEVDAIVANPLETMESKNISAQVMRKDGKLISPPQDIQKSQFAQWLIEHLDDILETT
jgi:phosphopantothenoylcysteine decarboxylase/phosphopantothenate--cysteine ligase